MSYDCQIVKVGEDTGADDLLWCKTCGLFWNGERNYPEYIEVAPGVSCDFDKACEERNR